MAKSRFAVVDKSRRTLDGIVFDSGREMQRYATLKLFERAGKIRELTRQPKFKVSIAGKLFCTYSADFSYVVVETGETVIEDCKSSGTAKDAAYRLRKKAAELQYGVTITEVGR